MLIELFITIFCFTPAMLASAIIYAALLLANAKIFSGVFKFTVGLSIYFIFMCIFVSPLFYLIGQYREAANKSTATLLFVLLSYAIIMAPSLAYLLKFKIRELQDAGYFLPRK